MKKIVCIGTKDFGYDGRQRLGRVYCKITIEEGKLSIFEPLLNEILKDATEKKSRFAQMLEWKLTGFLN